MKFDDDFRMNFNSRMISTNLDFEIFFIRKEKYQSVSVRYHFFIIMNHYLD